MKFLFLSSILMPWLYYVVQCDTPAGPNQEFDLNSFEKTSVPDQNQDATIFGNSENFGNQDKGNFFMDLYSIQTGPKQVEFGHVFEDPNTWEQRYEKKDHENKRFQGQARWGDKHGGYGEHYWDYNHGGDSHDEGTGNEEINGEFSRNVQSPSVMPPTSLIDARSIAATETPAPEIKSTYRKQKSSKYSKKPKYEEIRSRRLPKFEKSTEIASTSSTDSNVFIIPPKSLAESTSIYSFDDQPDISRGASDTTYGADLYDQLKNMPNAYNQFEEMYSTAPAGKLSAKYHPTERSRYAY